MQDATGYALVSVAVATALFHTLIPDHWLPFVLIGRARSWSVATTVAVSGVSAMIHVGLSVLLGLLALAVSATAADAIGEQLEWWGAWMLILFGLAYAIWSWRKGGHFHPGGARVHDLQPGGSCDGTEGDTNPEHLHYHADDELISGRAGRSAWWLAVIIGLNPCVLFLPIIMATAGRGPTAVAAVSGAYGATTAVLMVGLSAAGVAGGRRVHLPLAARYMEALSGLLIAILGLVIMAFGHHG